VIVREGEPGGDAFVIESGTVEVRRGLDPGREVALATLGPGEWFGEMGLLLEEPRTATVVAAGDVRARRISRETFEAAMASDPARALQLMRQLAARLRDVDRLVQ
jgi:CRP/FNR family cyclic AMP-dependent transcriptional regulator